MKYRAVVLSALLGLSLPLAANAQESQPTQRITLNQARAIAGQALQAGDAGTSRELALALVQANPSDADALALLAASELQLGRPRAAGQAARLSFGKAQGNKPLRYQSARMAAAASSAQGRQGIAKFWLRRAANNTNDPRATAQIAREFSVVDGRDRWEREFNFSVTPSSNLNGGARTDILEIDGVAGTGSLSGDAQALGGWQAVISARLAYRFQPRERSSTKIQLNYYQSLNWLNDEAKELAPDTEGSEFNYRIVGADLVHRFLPQGARGPYEARIGASQRWYGGEELLHVFSASLSKTTPIGPKNLVYGRLSYDREIADSDRARDADRYGLALSHTMALNGGGSFTQGITYSEFDSMRDNDDHVRAGVNLSYALGRQIGPVKMSFGLGYDWKYYETHVAGLSAVPGGRTDRTLSATVNLLFPDYQLFGFAPVVTFRGSNTSSNVSRYDTRDLSVGLSVRSAF